MNSSPPPPSFTLPPLNSAGQFPITPDDSPASRDGADDYLSAKYTGKARAVAVDEDEVRMSMYVKLFDGMSSRTTPWVAGVLAAVLEPKE